MNSQMPQHSDLNRHMSKQKNQKFSIRFRKDEKGSTSSWSIVLSKGIIERAEALQCTYVHFTVNSLLKEVQLKLCKHASTLEEISITTKNGRYRNVVYARSLITSIQEETSNHFNLMNTYMFTEHPIHADTFTYYFGYFNEEEIEK